MNKLLNPKALSSDLFLLLYRLAISAGMVYGHGFGKLERLFSGNEIKFYEFMGMNATVSLVLAVFAEFLMAIFVGLGLWTRLSAVPVMFTMLVAAFGAHADDGFRKMEMALAYFVLFAVVFIFGPGKYSIDQKLYSRK